MNTVFFLLLFPLAAAFILLIVPYFSARKWTVLVSAALVIAATVFFFIENHNLGLVYFDLNIHALDQIMMAVEALLAVYIVYLGVKHKKYFTALLMVIQVAVILYFEFTYGSGFHVEHNLFSDQFSLVMALIIGVIGSLICVYAVGYMKDYHHHHPEVKDRTPFFFFVLFVFLAAMFGVVFANNLLWLYFFWEITTICSFLLIGYTQSEAAVNNAFRALWMNLLGGLAFGAAIIYVYLQADILELDRLLSLNKSFALIPAVLLSFAGITKSAQFPFSSWLLGAMIAPTPTSALLHSSTMVKAGVYLIIRLAPVLEGTGVGLLVALVGAVTFLLASCIAISQLDAKKVLAYSTVANLGLIVTCGGAGSFELVWAGILLIIFHALAKSLLFLSVGPVEHHLGQRDIETMEGLVVKAPHLAVVMLIGIAGMFLAPFGMLLSKWAALEGLVRVNPVLTVFVAFGSAATLFFWTKWMGKLIVVKKKPEGLDIRIDFTENTALLILAVLTVGICILFPLLSAAVIEPYLLDVYGAEVMLGQGNIMIMLIMMALIFLLPLRLLFYKDLSYRKTYLGGANVTEEDKFLSALGQPRQFQAGNYYLETYFGEGRLARLGVVCCSCLIIMMFGVGLL